MSSDKEKFDRMLMSILVQKKGSIPDFMDVIIDFIKRRTEFGLAEPQQAKSMILNVLQKYSTVKNEPITELDFPSEDTQKLFENRKNANVSVKIKEEQAGFSTMRPPNSPQRCGSLDIVPPIQNTQYPISPLSARVRLLAKRKLFEEKKLPDDKCKKSEKSKDKERCPICQLEYPAETLPSHGPQCASEMFDLANNQ